ncbi:MAG: HK97 family phage prohead protease [candidate division WOR-3 bacterium]|nr:MAG: HK97 family phage prohead protease [candidate division WOR-3 bacterium]
MPWSDYPKGAKDNAKRALKHRDENGTDCGTPVGWQRANQLAKGEAISDDVLVRTFSFLSRAKVYDQGKFFDEDGKEICGSIMYAAWGGTPMLNWAKRTIEKMENEDKRHNERHIKSVVENDEEIIITFGKGEMQESGYKDEERAEPNELSVGDFVKWNSSGGNAYGRIIQVERDGEIEADSGFIVNGTADDPAALIRLYRYDSESDAYIERKPVLNVAHRFSTLEKFDAEVRKSSVVKEQREFRMENAEQEGNTIRGYAAVYNSDSEWMGGFYEQIATGAFDNVLDNDVRAYFNHDENLLLGRVSSGTLRIGTDKRGLYYEVDLPNTTYANDLVELMKRGDVNQSSFAFLIDEDRWEQRDGKTYRIIEKVSRLLDVSPVSQPAYPDATSELKRDLETETKEEIETAAVEDTASEAVETKEEDSNLYLYKSKILNF